MKNVFAIFALAGLIFVSAEAQAACDPAARGAQFQATVQAMKEKSPEKLQALAAEMKAMQEETQKLAAEGKVEEICAAMDAMEAKLQ